MDDKRTSHAVDDDEAWHRATDPDGACRNFDSLTSHPSALTRSSLLRCEFVIATDCGVRGLKYRTFQRLACNSHRLHPPRGSQGDAQTASHDYPTIGRSQDFELKGTAPTRSPTGCPQLVGGIRRRRIALLADCSRPVGWCCQVAGLRPSAEGGS